MLRLSTFCMLLTLAVAQSGYDYNKPNRPFGQGTSSSRPGTSLGSSVSTTTSYPIRPQNDDFSGPGGPTTGRQNYPGSSSQRPGYQDSTYPQGPSGPSGYSGQSDSYPGSRGPARYPGQGSTYPGQNQNYPGQSGFGPVGFADDTGNYEGGDYSAIPGEPDIDYPVLSYVPQTSFNCQSLPYPGYYADVETRCQVFHVCSNNKTYDFLCPNGTVFSQEDFVCVWWNQFSCDEAPSLYELNAKIYDYSNRDSSGNYPITNLNDYQGSSYAGNRGPQGPTSQRPSTYPGSGPQGPSTPYPGGPGSYSSSQGPGSYPGSQGPSTGYPGSQRPSGGYPGSQGPSGNYPGNQGPSGNYPGSQGPSGSYPGPQGSSDSYPGSQGPSGNYPGSQSPSGSYPGSQGSNSYPGPYTNGPQSTQGSPGSPGRPGSGYPGSKPSSTYPGSSPGSNYPGSGPANQGYPSGRPSGPGFPPGSNRGSPAQKPNREYLPPRN